MARCLQLAGNGRGFVAPNPMVGSVVVCQDRIIGEGFHRKHGGSHAEVHAIGSVRERDLLRESTLYVNLEPCSHYGKTPPCSELIIRSGIPQVVVGMQDPFPEVAGRGIKQLRDAGIEVTVGVMESECKELNKRFLTFHAKHRPYIILKWAQSSDGFIDLKREIGDGKKPVKFSNHFTQVLVHKLRAEESAIIVGSRTESLDNPQLNVRYWNGADPIRIKSDSRRPLSDLMTELYDRKLLSLIVEGGSALLSSFIEANLWDEARIEISSVRLGEGIKSPILRGELESVQKCKKSEVFLYRNDFKL